MAAIRQATFRANQSLKTGLVYEWRKNWQKKPCSREWILCPVAIWQSCAYCL